MAKGAANSKAKLYAWLALIPTAVQAGAATPYVQPLQKQITPSKS